ncbi:MFS transporter [Halorubrum sp. JWXQ-INN 858]|uniref:MFS transporter n=1 Tax=Halorubrum sp. JWXQ-INN 858 TaxID=2690782 RepID=UPI001358011D|nr:MFS transporter [Halorubrum sp. JWXQ-INN 858]MWV65296.1 MFS transporter [Halorubrum sp. JWXQ-INN 858]
MASRRVWMGAACLFIAGDGMAMQARGPLLASFEAEFGASQSLLGLVAPAGTVGFVVSILAVGLFASRLDVKRTLLVGAVATAASLALLAAAPVYWVFLGALLVQGASAGVFRAIDRPLLSHLYPDTLGRVFVLYALAWAVGAVTGPIVVSAVLELTGWRWTFLLLALWFVPVAVVVAASSLPTTAWDERTIDRRELRALCRRPSIAGTLVAMALVGGIEGAIFTWLPYYVGTFTDPTLANLTLSAYLLAYVPGRLLYSRVVGRVAYVPLAIATTVFATPVLALVFYAPGGVPMLASILLAGALLSALFPVLSAFGVEAAPEYSGPVSALATGATYLGIAVAPVAIGVLAERIGIAAAMSGVVLTLCGLLVATLVSVRRLTTA